MGLTLPFDICSRNYFAAICCNEEDCTWKKNYERILQKEFGMKIQ